MKIIKTNTEEFDIYQAVKNFLPNNDIWKKIRKNQTCKLCHKPFGDYIHLAFVRGKVNMPICDKCMDKLEKSGTVDIKMRYKEGGDIVEKK